MTMGDPRVVQSKEPESDEQFLVRLQELALNWRYSDEYLGIVVRHRYPREYAKEPN